MATATATRTRPPATAPPGPPPTTGTTRPERPRRLTWRVVLFLTCVVGVLGVVAASVAWYARSAYFVGIDNEQVAIFRGRPGGFLWFEPTLVDRKELSVEDVLPAKVDELRAGKEEPSKADADRYVNNLRQEAEERRAATTTTTTTTPPTTPAVATTRAGPP